MNPQAIIARPPKRDWVVSHLLLTFSSSKNPLSLLRAVDSRFGFTFAESKNEGKTNKENAPELYIGFTYQGFLALDLPGPYLRQFAQRSPSFYQGAARRSPFLGDTGVSSPELWEAQFNHLETHAVLSIYAMNQGEIDQLIKTIFEQICTPEMALTIQYRFANTNSLNKPLRNTDFDQNEQNIGGDTKAQFVHFGYRDGLTSVGFSRRGSKSPPRIGFEEHEPGEFLLGRQNNEGANRWALSAAPKKLRQFFLDASFGVLRKIEQDVGLFEREVARWSEQSGLDAETIKAKLCGRYASGHLISADGVSKSNELGPADHSNDIAATVCPYGAHIRRMNPQNIGVVHARQRPLLRRGMPYGKAYVPHESNDAERGLMALFFCSSIEQQFEHLLESWADRLPMGFGGDSAAKDPLIGMHENRNARFEIPLAQKQAVQLTGFTPFVRTRGMVYGFYPSKAGLDSLLSGDIIKDENEEDA